MRAIKSLIRIGAIATKEWIHIRRDMRSLIISLATPAFMIIIFGYALTVDVKHVSTAIFDQDKSSLSRRFLEEFSHTEYLDIYKYVNNYREIDSLIDSGNISMAMVIPRNFEKSFKSGKAVDVQLLVDGSDSTSAMVAVGYVKAIIANYNIDVKINELKRIGISGNRMPVEVKSRIWYNPELLSKNFIVPSLIVIVLAVISSLIGSLTISREWERGTMETLITTPVRRFEVVTGKLIPYLFIGLFDVVFTLLIGHFIFDVPIKGSFIELCLVSLLFLIGTLSLGIMISSATRVQVLSVQVAIMSTYLPSLILSGFIFPIANMPLVVRAITYVIPAKYLIIVIKGIALKGISVTLMWTQILFLFLYAFIVFALSIRKLSLKLPEA